MCNTRLTSLTVSVDKILDMQHSVGQNTIACLSEQMKADCLMAAERRIADVHDTLGIRLLLQVPKSGEYFASSHAKLELLLIAVYIKASFS